MRNLFLAGVALLTVVCCGTKKVAENADNLPKDVALKPDNNISQQHDQEVLRHKLNEITTLIEGEKCTKKEEWSFAAIGAKPCGGPSSYIGYPKKIEAEILPKIQEFTALQDAFNKKYRLMSDCMLVPEPAGIRCEEGKAVLISGASASVETDSN